SAPSRGLRRRKFGNRISGAFNQGSVSRGKRYLMVRRMLNEVLVNSRLECPQHRLTTELEAHIDLRQALIEIREGLLQVAERSPDGFEPTGQLCGSPQQQQIQLVESGAL